LEKRKKSLFADEAQPGGSLIRAFWESAGASIPSFFGAPSTRYYFECERTLFEKCLGNLGGKNSRILNWAAAEGAETYGLDISLPIIREAKKFFGPPARPRRFIASDIRRIGFQDESFDLIYSMGTIEHFPEYRQALLECFRVLRTGGMAVIGVPNKFDPFLRPLMVTFLNSLDLYAYGYEKSFTWRELEDLLRDCGFQIIGRTGILWMPGWLRMLDLMIWVRRPRLKFVTEPLILPFYWLYKKVPFLHRYGYLIACVVRKPAAE
jgi:SAM-dependent methyltransferase